MVEPVDADADLPARRGRRPWRAQPWDVLGVVACGGAAGGCARYGITVAWPTGMTGFPWPTFAVNVSGCALIGVLMVLVDEVWAAHRLVRPLLGTGVLGGFTTFSAYTVDVQRLVGAGRPGPGLLDLAGTLLAALAAVWAAATLTRRTVAAKSEGRPR